MTTHGASSAAKGRIISSLLAGFIAGFVWMAITVSAGGLSKGAIVGWGIGFLIIGSVGTYLIAAVIESRATPKP